MAITNLKVSNFKSFKDLDLNLGRFNVVVGANAAGKSNLVEVFRFLRDIQDNNLDNVLSMHGGFRSLHNLKADGESPLAVEVRVEPHRHKSESTEEHGWATEVIGLTYSCVLGSRGNGSVVERELLRQDLEFYTHGQDKQRVVEADSGVVRAELTVLNNHGKVSIQTDPSEDELQNLLKQRRGESAGFLLFVPQFYQEKTERYKSLLIRIPHLFHWPSEKPFGGIGVYDMDPHLAKKPAGIAGQAELQENGENLALVLRQILDNSEKSRMFHNLLQYMLPFAAAVGTEQSLGNSVLLKLREEYHQDSLLANLLSDGTVDVVALITALFFEDKDVVIIEEPERNIHPHLISGLMRLMEDASGNKQIIITTHSPEVVRHAGVENLLLISRDKEGYSRISRPAEREMVKVFLKNELGLDELFVQDALAT